MDWDTLPLIIRLVFSFLAAFPAVAIWSRSRDAAWILLVLAAIFFFIDTLFQTLVLVGIATYTLPWLSDIPLLKSILTGLPLFFLSLGFLVHIFRDNRY